MAKFLFGKKPVIVAIGALVVLGASSASFSLRSDSTASATEEPRNNIDALLATLPTSPEQEQILADGAITDAEYVSAIERAQSCVEAKGLIATPLGDPRLEGKLGFGFVIPATVEYQVGKDAAGACMSEHLNKIEWAYHLLAQGATMSAHP